MEATNTNLLSDNKQHRRLSNESLEGPTIPQKQFRFYIIICFFLLIAAANTFISKTVYQLLPNNESKKDYWVSYLLTFAQFLISIPILLFAGKAMFKKFASNIFHYLWRFCAISIFDIFVNGGRYIALIYLPAALVSLLSTVLQIIFLTLIRRCRKRKISIYNYIGVLIALIGIIAVTISNMLSSSKSNTNSQQDNTYGTIIMLFVGLSGAIRCTIEEILLKRYDNDTIEMDFNPAFVLGIESLISFIFTLILGLVLVGFHFDGANFDNIFPILRYNLIHVDYLLLCVLLFLLGIFFQDYLKMFVTKMSSAVTRKLVQSIQPSLIWIMSLIIYYSAKSDTLGEKWNNEWYGSFLRLFGFLIVWFGVFIFMKQKKRNENKNMSIQQLNNH
eukprot:299500_1